MKVNVSTPLRLVLYECLLIHGIIEVLSNILEPNCLNRGNVVLYNCVMYNMQTEKTVKKLNTNERIKLDKPLEVYKNNAGWTWKVWRKYQKAELEAKNPYARWFCSVSSPMTMGGWDMGDTYVSDIKRGGGILTFKE